MNINKIVAGKNIPEEINVIIEVSMGSDPVKYEMDKESGAIFVDRFLQTSMHYPCNYGFIPHTKSGDGDPVDVLVYSPYPLIPLSVIPCRPIGVLLMEDESGVDEKILAVPITKLDPTSENILSYRNLPTAFTDKISHFFENYKKLEKNKWVKIIGWEDRDKALNIIKSSILQ
jgi:inorganic pyrophosphatase